MSNIIFRDPQVTIFQSALFQTNSVVIKTEDVVLVVDPAWLPEEVMDIRHYVDRIRGKLPVFLLFTHSDFDHIIGYRAFEAEKVFMTEAMAQNPDKQAILRQILDFDEQYYIDRPYPIEYPEGDFLVYKDGAQYRQGNTKLAFYLAPGHTADGMMIVVWQIGLCIAGDYLSKIEFPVIDHSSVEYEATLEKIPLIHDRNWFTRLVPGHGEPALSINEWLQRRTESLVYLYAIRESIVTGVPLDENSLWRRYRYHKFQHETHRQNVARMTKEYEDGLWTWDPVLRKEDLSPPLPEVKDREPGEQEPFQEEK